MWRCKQKKAAGPGGPLARRVVIFINNKIITSAIVLATAGALTFGTATVSANMQTDSTFVKTFAQKLGVSEDKVKTALDSMKTDRQSEMQKSLEDRLSQLVKNGKITEAQKTLITNKMKEIKANRSAKKEDLQKWAKDNNIDLKYLSFRAGFKGFRHK